MDIVSREDVLQVAHLARLALSDDEITRLQRELNRIMEHFAELQQLDTENVEPTSHPMPMTNVFREDQVQPSLSVDEVLRNAPDRYDEFFRVPRIVDTEA